MVTLYKTSFTFQAYFCLTFPRKYSKNIEWIIHSIYGVKKCHSLSEFHSILTPVEWIFTTERVEFRPVHSIFSPKEVIIDVTTQGVTNRVKMHFTFLESSLLFIIIGFTANFRHLCIQFHQFSIQFRPEKLTAFKSKVQFRKFVIHTRFLSIRFQNSAFKFVICHWNSSVSLSELGM